MVKGLIPKTRRVTQYGLAEVTTTPKGGSAVPALMAAAVTVRIQMPKESPFRPIIPRTTHIVRG